MAKPKVDYDRVAHAYDGRYAPGLSLGIEQALLRLAGSCRERLLEVGCGTGHWVRALQAAGAQVCGLEPSTGMLAQARRHRPPLPLVCGVAERPPLAAGSFGIVFVVHALHHFDDPAGFFREAARILAPGGTLAIVGSDPYGRPESWYGFHYFDGAYETDLRRMPRWQTVAAWMGEAGFCGITLEDVERITEVRRGSQVFDDPFLAKDSCSQLVLLSHEVYRAGLARMEADIEGAQARGKEAVFHTDIRVEMMSGRCSGGDCGLRRGP